MILMRVATVLGMCEINPYGDGACTEGGWYPVNSASFGFESAGSESSEVTSQNGKSGASASQKKTAASSEGSKDSEIKIEKNVDFSTANLMKVAMNCRSKRGKDKMTLTDADIHFVGTTRRDDGIHTWAFLRIHLEAVVIKSWNLSASGDQRPTESITLGYEKIAMCYAGTADARIQDAKQNAGWDQAQNKDWPLSEIAFTKFFPDFPS
jgi:type VI protein secretion system component Hcp